MGIKLISSLLILCLCIGLVGCGKTATSSGKLIEHNGLQDSLASSPVDSSNENSENDTVPEGVVATVNGEELRPDDFGYYIYNEAIVQMYAMDSSADFLTFDWSTLMNGRPVSEIVAEAAISDAIADTVFRQKAGDCGYSVSEAEKTASSLVDAAIERNGEDGFKRTSNKLGITDSDQYKKIYTNIIVFDDVSKDFQENPNRYISDVSVLDSYADNRGASAQQILILKDTQKGDPLALSGEVNSRAKNGDDFADLMSKFNEDTAVDKENVYTFAKGEMVSPFENAVFGLEIGEISDIVESDYGYHTIRRVCGAYELRNYWKKESDIKIDDRAAEMINFDEIINMARAAEDAAE